MIVLESVNDWLKKNPIRLSKDNILVSKDKAMLNSNERKGDDRKVIQKMTSNNRMMLQGKKILVIKRILQERDFGK